MKSPQVRNLVILVALVALTYASWRFNRLPEQTAVAAAAAVKPQGQQESPLLARFKKIRAEMDVLYHYRGKPTPLDASSNPFRLPVIPGIHAASVVDAQKTGAPAPAPAGESDFGPPLLARAIANIRFGGIVTMNGVIQLTVDGQLHKQGDVFTTRLNSRLVLIRIRDLTTTHVTLALDDPNSGVAASRVRLK